MVVELATDNSRRGLLLRFLRAMFPIFLLDGMDFYFMNGSACSVRDGLTTWPDRLPSGHLSREPSSRCPRPDQGSLSVDKRRRAFSASL